MAVSVAYAQTSAATLVQNAISAASGPIALRDAIAKLIIDNPGLAGAIADAVISEVATLTAAGSKGVVAGLAAGLAVAAVELQNSGNASAATAITSVTSNVSDTNFSSNYSGQYAASVAGTTYTPAPVLASGSSNPSTGGTDSTGNEKDESTSVDPPPSQNTPG